MASPAGQRVVGELWRLPPNSELSLDQWRSAAAWREREPLPPDLRTLPVEAGDVEAEWSWLHPAGMSDGPVVLFLHGGGFIVCSIGTHRVLGARVAAGAGGRSLMVGYRLAPEHPFPQPVEDCVAAYRWLLEEGVAPERIAFFGDSAGGNLCLAAGLLAARDGIPLPAAMVLASPAPDLTFSGPSNVAKRDVDPFSRIDNPARMVEYYLRGADPRDPLASPVFADLTGFPPLLIMVGPDETLVDDCHALAERATKCGVDTELQVVEGAFHTWLGYAGVVPEADDCITRIGTFIAKHTRGTL